MSLNWLYFIFSSVVQCSGRAFILHAKGPWIKPPLVNVFFFNFLGTQVQIWAKKSILQHPSTLMPHPSGALYGPPEQSLGGWEAAESGGNWLKMQNKL